MTSFRKPALVESLLRNEHRIPQESENTMRRAQAVKFRGRAKNEVASHPVIWTCGQREFHLAAS